MSGTQTPLSGRRELLANAPKARKGMQPKPLAERFWPKVERGDDDECWTWLGARSPNGYGRFNVNGRSVPAHRVAFALSFGEPVDAFVCHRCDNPSCVNPSHLFAADHRANMADMDAKGRRVNAGSLKTHCPRGHVYDDANTYRHRGQRHCRACARERWRERAAPARLKERT